MRLLVACLILASPAVAAVRIDSGLVGGVAGRDPAIQVYKGIPYAAPPVGDLRWHSPRPVKPWTGVRQADQFSPVCYQPPYRKGSLYFSDPEPMSEDCLTLNVWTGAQGSGEARPVMVWIHGGALTRGSGSLPLYDGESLAKKGVVVVTINYRLGVFGFLAHPELTRESDHNSSGNYAFLDQIAALQWVKKNIAAFGGDPKKVTIFGESAGAWSVNYLMATPLAKGLFERAIGESGAAFGPMQTLLQTEGLGTKFASSMGADSIQALRTKPAEDVLKRSGLASFPPCVDGWMLPESVYDIFEHGKQNDVPLIAGSNADEATSLAPWPENRTLQAFRKDMQQRFGSLADEFFKIYPADTEAQAKAAHYASIRDLLFGWQMRTWVREQTSTGHAPAFLYYFSYVPADPESARYGAYHASEIAYVFNNLDRTKHVPTEADAQLADRLSSYWVNFAATGDPNRKALPEWPPYQRSSDEALEFGRSIKEVAHLHQAALDFLTTFYQRQRIGTSGN
jgi:para-nitrobenzyl esterase